MDFDEIYAELLKRSRRSLVSAPPVRVPPFLLFYFCAVLHVEHIFCRLRVLALFDPISLQLWRMMVDSLPSLKIQTMKKSISMPLIQRAPRKLRTLRQELQRVSLVHGI